MLSDTQRAKKLARVTAQDRQEPNTQERHGIDLEVLEGGDSPDMFEMFELRQGDDDEMARNWEQAVIAPLGATLSSLVKKQARIRHAMEDNRAKEWYLRQRSSPERKGGKKIGGRQPNGG